MPLNWFKSLRHWCSSLNSSASHWISQLFSGRVIKTIQQVNTSDLINAAMQFGLWAERIHVQCGARFKWVLFHFWRINIIKHLSNSWYCFIEKNYIAIIFIIVLSPRPNCKVYFFLVRDASGNTDCLLHQFLIVWELHVWRWTAMFGIVSTIKLLVINCWLSYPCKYAFKCLLFLINLF